MKKISLYLLCAFARTLLILTAKIAESVHLACRTLLVRLGAPPESVGNFDGMSVNQIKKKLGVSHYEAYRIYKKVREESPPPPQEDQKNSPFVVKRLSNAGQTE